LSGADLDQLAALKVTASLFERYATGGDNKELKALLPSICCI